MQIFATSRRRCVSLIVPRPLCAGATSDYVGVMPARSRKSLAKLADHAAKRALKAEPPPPTQAGRAKKAEAKKAEAPAAGPTPTKRSRGSTREEPPKLVADEGLQALLAAAATVPELAGVTGMKRTRESA